MTFLVAATILIVVILISRRRARASRLAGLDSARPVFSVEPPTRRLGSRKGERL